MELEREETELTITIKIKTVRWNCSWDWRQRAHPPAAMVDYFPPGGSAESQRAEIVRHAAFIFSTMDR